MGKGDQRVEGFNLHVSLFSGKMTKWCWHLEWEPKTGFRICGTIVISFQTSILVEVEFMCEYSMWNNSVTSSKMINSKAPIMILPTPIQNIRDIQNSQVVHVKMWLYLQPVHRKVIKNHPVLELLLGIGEWFALREISVQFIPIRVFLDISGSCKVLFGWTVDILEAVGDAFTAADHQFWI